MNNDKKADLRRAMGLPQIERAERIPRGRRALRRSTPLRAMGLPFLSFWMHFHRRRSPGRVSKDRPEA